MRGDKACEFDTPDRVEASDRDRDGALMAIGAEEIAKL
jgi:hypothetical protein